MTEMAISVVMTTYNGEKFLSEQMDSILKQSVLPDEIIVVDDCSTDGTWDILMEYAAKYAFIKASRTDSNIGAHQNFRKALALSSCPLIAPSDQDDIWREDHLQVMRDILVERNAEFVYSQDDIMWENGSIEAFPQKMPALRELIWRNNMRGHTFLFKRELLAVFDTVKHLPFDHALALKASMSKRYGSTDEALSIWRRHKGVCTTAMSDHSELVYQSVSRRKKLRYTFRHLRDERSLPIQVNFEEVGIILFGDPSFKRYAKVCKCMAKQTHWSMASASWNNAMIQEYDGGLKNRIAHFLWALRYPWIFWYDMHGLHAL